MPLVIDLFCGLGGWAEGFLAEGYDVVGFDIERHVYGDQKYPAQLVLQDVLMLDGKQFKDAAVIVASPPCQEYSWMAMPWSLAKKKAAWYREDVTRQLELNCLFNACFRIAHEAQVPLIVENVRGARPWVGPSKYSYGPFHLWGDVPALMPRSQRPQKNGHIGGGSWFNIPGPGGVLASANPDGRKVPGMNFHEHEKTGKPGRSFQSAAVEGLKVPAEAGRHTDPGKGTRFASQDCREEKGFAKNWRDSPNGMPMMSSKSSARKAASAQIAKIPFPLAQHIAKVFKHG